MRSNDEQDRRVL